MVGRPIRAGFLVGLLGLVASGCAGATTPSTSTSPVATTVSVAPSLASVAPSVAPATSAPAVASNPAPSEAFGLHLVAVGDSIPYNSPDDCPGCTGFVDRYGAALGEATGMSVGVQNLSAHDGHTIDDLLDDLDTNDAELAALAAADAIIVGIAHNDAPMNRDDDACDGAAGDNPVWAKFTPACIATEVHRFTPKYAKAFEHIAALRAGKPTILLAIDRYNDWIGWPGHDLPAEGVKATTAVIAAWNDMICGTAKASGFTCADISTEFNGADGKRPSGALLANDYTHPSDAGNEAIANVLVDLGFAPLVP